MIEKIRTALIERSRTETWTYLEEQTGIDASQLCGFATNSRTIGSKKLEILADYLGLTLVAKK